MLPLHAARLSDLGQGDFVKVDCAACHHVALLTPEALVRMGLLPATKVLDLNSRLRCRECGSKGGGRWFRSPGEIGIRDKRDVLPSSKQRDSRL